VILRECRSAAITASVIIIVLRGMIEQTIKRNGLETRESRGVRVSNFIRCSRTRTVFRIPTPRLSKILFRRPMTFPDDVPCCLTVLTVTV
jgi:hypothetical protein